MAEAIFKYERDLLKHHVRVEGWLPRCKKRLKIVRESSTGEQTRRLRYFTFCATGAIDVLMLDVAKVITRSGDRGFNNVFFFDRNRDLVRETLKRIPGAIGFPGDFVSTVLVDDPDEQGLLAERRPLLDQQDPLLAPESAQDDSITRLLQLRLHVHQEFVKCFPFDVINLDLEEYLFKPQEKLPGRLINALRKVFAWQRREFVMPPKKSPQTLTGFSLMFTTRIGPENLSEDYLGMLRGYLEDNICKTPALGELLRAKTGVAEATILQREQFEAFFKLAMPKTLAATLMVEDWCIDPDSGLLIYEFTRTPPGVESYKMLHLVMDVKRHNPPEENRAPGVMSLEATQAYEGVVREIFEKPEIVVAEASIDTTKLEKHLDLIIARRRKYYPDEES
jgi:hypothetical protein